LTKKRKKKEREWKDDPSSGRKEKRVIEKGSSTKEKGGPAKINLCREEKNTVHIQPRLPRRKGGGRRKVPSWPGGVLTLGEGVSSLEKRGTRSRISSIARRGEKKDSASIGRTNKKVRKRDNEGEPKLRGEKKRDLLL